MRRRLAGAVGGALVGALVLSGCGTEDHDQSLLGPAGPTSAAAATASPRPPVDRRPVTRPATRAALLRALSRAVLDHDRRRFASLLGTGDPAFRAQQLRLYDNLQRLPVSALSFSAGDDGVTRSLSLGAYDARPVVAPAGFAVAFRGGRAVAVRDQAHGFADPWDLTGIRVGADGGALVVTDEADAGRLPDLLAATRAALVDDDRAIPLAWSHTAVLYAFRDPAVIASYAQVPGGNPNHLGALTYPVRDAEGGQAGSRVAVLPAALDADGSELRRVLRHEVTHVAVGVEADGVPTWLSEGLAEYVAARPTPPRRRRIATVAVDAARAGVVTIPADFADGDQSLAYAESWQACEYLAASRGPSVLWRLLDAMHRSRVGRDGRSGPGQDVVLRRVAGVTSARLATRTAARIRQLFG